MLCQVIGEETRGVVSLDQPQPVRIGVPDCGTALVEVVEDSEFDLHPYVPCDIVAAPHGDTPCWTANVVKTLRRETVRFDRCRHSPPLAGANATSRSRNCCIDRRGFFAGLAAAGSAGLLPTVEAAAQAPLTPFRIDVHHHPTPPAYVEELSPMKNLTQVQLSWSVSRAIEQMDKGGVAVSITSITTPGLWFGSPSPARRLARACNEYAAKLVADHPRRFGMFVNVSL